MLPKIYLLRRHLAVACLCRSGRAAAACVAQLRML